MTLDPFRLGEHEGRLQALDDRACRVEHKVDLLGDKLDTVLQSLSERRGERKAAAWIASSLATVISIVIALFARLADHR